LLKIYNQTQTGTRIHGNTSYEPLATTNDAIWAGEQDGQKKKKCKK